MVIYGITIKGIGRSEPGVGEVVEILRQSFLTLFADVVRSRILMPHRWPPSSSIPPQLLHAIMICVMWGEIFQRLFVTGVCKCHVSFGCCENGWTNTWEPIRKGLYQGLCHLLLKADWMVAASNAGFSCAWRGLKPRERWVWKEEIGRQPKPLNSNIDLYAYYILLSEVDIGDHKLWWWKNCWWMS